jgi:hypothetical protein
MRPNVLNRNAIMTEALTDRFKVLAVVCGDRNTSVETMPGRLISEAF